MLEKLLTLRDRSVFYVQDTKPAVFYLADKDGGGVLINTPVWHEAVYRELQTVTRLNYIFFPSRFGAQCTDIWRSKTGAKTMAYGEEATAIGETIDIVLEREHRFSRTVDFLPMSGRTRASCALRCKNKPGIVFFGPILDYGPSGWPTIIPHDDDYSFENRLFGALGLQDVKFEYAFADDFAPGKCYHGPGADAAIRSELRNLIETI